MTYVFLELPTYRQRDRHTSRQTYISQANRQRQAKRQIDTQSVRETNIQTYIPQPNKQTGREKDRQIETQADRHIYNR